MRRALVAIKLVQMASWFIERSYVIGQIHGHRRCERTFNWATRGLGKRLIRMALTIDKEAAVTQMIEESWWG